MPLEKLYTDEEHERIKQEKSSIDKLNTKYHFGLNYYPIQY